MTDTKTYPLRLSHSVRKSVTKIAEEEGVSVNQFIATEVAEKLAAMSTAEFFAERKARADSTPFAASCAARAAGRLQRVMS